MVPPLVLLQAYGELADQHPEYLKRYFEVLDQLERTDPGNPLVLAATGTRDLQAGKYEEAVAKLQSALEAGPPKTVLYTELADALVKLDRSAEAAVVLRKAIGLDPFNSAVQKTLIVRLIELKEFASARTALESYVARFPEDSFMRQMLARAGAAAAEMISETKHVGADVLICPVERSSTESERIRDLQSASQIRPSLPGEESIQIY